MKFYCFPKRQPRCLLYASYEGFRSRLFSDLILQASPKNSLFFRYRNTYLGHLLGFFFKEDFDPPNEKADYIGIKKEDRLIFFEMDGSIPVKVWRTNDSTSGWVSEPFVGYQIISDYSIAEFNRKHELILKALKLHWTKIENTGQIHGDLTHFNILYNKKGKLFFIDEQKDVENSPLFDFFYFYSYLNQSISRRKRISKAEKESILNFLGSLITSVCSYSNYDDFRADFDAIDIPAITGIKKENQKMFLQEFHDLFDFE